MVCGVGLLFFWCGFVVVEDEFALAVVVWCRVVQGQCVGESTA